jgi:transposase
MSMMDSGRCWNRCCRHVCLCGSGCRIDACIAFTAILFVLVTGAPWRLLTREIGCSGVTAWRRLRDWQAAGVWNRLHRELLRRLNALGRLDWSTAVVDGSHIRALRGGPLTGRSPVDRGRTGSTT